MAGTTPSSVTRYRPAVLVVTGAAAAYAAWLLYTSVAAPSSPPDTLHRSNAVRRSNRRARDGSRESGTSRAVQRLQQESVPLGHFDFFGHDVELDARNVVSDDHLREIAQQMQPTASPEMVEDRIMQLYDTFYDRLLGYAFPERALSTVETDVLTRMVADQIPNPEGLARAMQRHRSRFALVETEALLTADGAESIPPTELSWHSDDDTEGGIDPDGQTLQRTLYHIAEDRARHEGVVHRGITCNGCEAKPIRGIRWRCANCPDYDLCSDCEATNSHIKTHIFYKIRVPAPYMGLPKQEPIYPGRPYLMEPSVDPAIKKSLVEQTRMEVEEIEALWDQFTCLASTEWTSDPNKVGWAMDRRAFDHAFIPRYSSFMSAPNLVYDRIFAYFDTDLNGLIGFEEFIKGLDGIHSSDSRIKLRIAFNGYDIDGDGYISRKDILRIFRAHYAIERESTRNYLAEAAEELSIRGALETIRSAQPLGSAFTQSGFPPVPRENERLIRKDPNASDLEPTSADVPDTMPREEFLNHPVGNTYHQPSGQEAIMYRWDRRQFYTDEEEGLTRPVSVSTERPFPDQLDHQTDGEDEAPSASDLERRRGSRSSSRVRFQDDVDFETRSNASTSSRPIGERWGGYEIPEPEQDLGKEILYQVTQQAFNELLDPLFRKKEDAAIDAFATRAERRLYVTEIDNLCEDFKNRPELNTLALRLGAFVYAEMVLRSFCADSDALRFSQDKKLTNREVLTKHIQKKFSESEQRLLEHSDFQQEPRKVYTNIDMWNAKLCRTQLLQETTEAIVQLLDGLITTESTQMEKTEACRVYRDPTMPQFRPNSLGSPEHGDSDNILTSETSHESTSKNTDQIRSPFGPFFVTSLVPSTPVPDSPEDGVRASLPSPPTPPRLSPEPTGPVPLTNDKVQLMCLSWDPDHEKLAFDWVPSPYWMDDDLLKHPEAMQLEALSNKSSPLHLPYLASLESMDREVAHRKGSGLLDFEEFMASPELGRLRFLEGWMDLVSF
ncbi:hypothetical protein DM02DRAFT_544435 [Periconia macrospinosa]|uniref:EF-hand n=1 Tax=Periconia macrospinosa TaxID=97972 RepID=A0A2V1D220_9PLEO|nr:hypothetical protein DM02DRAFT_544435 [Periconia macrospinosa]